MLLANVFDDALHLQNLPTHRAVLLVSPLASREFAVARAVEGVSDDEVVVEGPLVSFLEVCVAVV
jgi:hypothetical protein